MNDEHVIPKSLGGYRSTVIRTSAHLNSRFATEIDARVADDPMIILARRRAGAKGHSGKLPLPRIRGARSWKAGEPFNEGETRYTLEFPADPAPARVWDRRTRTYLPPGAFRNTGYIVPDWKFDHVARLRFTVKTLLGVGWKFFGPDLLEALDCELLRATIDADIELGSAAIRHEPERRSLSYADVVLAPAGSRDEKALQAIQAVLVQENITTILMRELDGSLEWSVACVGEMVGAIRMQMRAPLIAGDIEPRSGLRLEIRREGLKAVQVAPFD